MAKKKKRSSESKSSDGQSTETITRLNVPVLILSALGVVLTLMLSWIKFNQGDLPYCDAGSGCDVVQNSRWSTFLGIPISLWGLAVYLGILLVTIRAPKSRRSWRGLIFFASLGFGVSLYLTAVSVFEIRATCTYCLVSLGLLSAIYLLAWLEPAAKSPNMISWGVGSGFAAVGVVGFLFLHYAGVFDPAAGPEDPYLKSLATHLTESGAKFYGAYWCPHCQQQKAAFGASADRLPYVECSPNGPKGARNTDCLSEQIQNYPTWIIDGRRIERALAAGQLARLSDFEGPEEVDGSVKKP